MAEVRNAYVHGYELKENLRLQDQASTLSELLHSGIAYQAGSRVLEAGCGVGAQTVILAKNSPGAQFISVDISASSIDSARKTVAAAGFTNVEFQQGDIFDLPFQPNSFDHIFICFLLEHLPNPGKALEILKKFLKGGGTITVIEGDHGSASFFPDSELAHEAIDCQVELQKRAGGNAQIGRELYPLLSAAGFNDIRVSPRFVYVDESKPDLVDGFTKKTFIAMIESVRESAISAGLTDPTSFDKGIQDLYRTTGAGGVFCYTFFKAVGMKA